MSAFLKELYLIKSKHKPVSHTLLAIAKKPLPGLPGGVIVSSTIEKNYVLAIFCSKCHFLNSELFDFAVIIHP